MILKVILYSISTLLTILIEPDFKVSAFARFLGFFFCYAILALFILNSFVVSLIIFEIPISGTSGMFLGILFSVAQLRHVFNF